MIMSGQLFVFSAPSGTGKSTIIEALRGRVRSTSYSVSHTTRPPRGEEKDGVDYFFVDEAEFKDMISRGEMVEWALVYGCYYGTSAAKLRSWTASGMDVLLDVDTEGAFNIKRIFHDSVLIFILPPSLDELERRLVERATDAPGTIRSRMAEARSILSKCMQYDYLVVNDNLEEAVSSAEAIIKACRCRPSRLARSIEDRFRLGIQDGSGDACEGGGGIDADG
jgi:guanylate kinase